MTITEPTPLDIKPCWFNPIRRLQSVAAKSAGMAIVSMKFLIDEKGVPVQWTDPAIVYLEPKRDTKTILDLLTS
jgi:hypothetical protein